MLLPRSALIGCAWPYLSGTVKPVGQTALRGGGASLLVALSTATLSFLLAWTWKIPCAVTDWFHAHGGRMWASSCYNDLTLLFRGRGLDVGHFPYLLREGAGSMMEYPVLTGLWMWAVARLSAALGVVAGPAWQSSDLDIAMYFTLSAVLLWLADLVAVYLTWKLAAGRPWDVLIMTASPLLVVHGLTNWDALPIVLTAGAMYAWASKRPLWAGVLIGLGAAAKLYPVFLLGALFVVCLRAGKLPDWLRATAAAALAWLAVNVPIMVASPRGWYEFVRLNSERGPEWGTWYFMVSALTGRNVPGLNAVSLLLFVLACLGISWLALAASRRPRLAQLIFLLVAAFLLTNKVWSPQYSLWLLPLAVLAIPRSRPLLAWQLAEVAVWLLVTPLLGPLESPPVVYPFLAVVVVRDALLVWLVWLVVKDVLHPERDLLRREVDDPVGGVVAGARDAFRLAGARFGRANRSASALRQVRRSSTASNCLVAVRSASWCIDCTPITNPTTIHGRVERPASQ